MKDCIILHILFQYTARCLCISTLLHYEWPKLNRILATLTAEEFNYGPCKLEVLSNPSPSDIVRLNTHCSDTWNSYDSLTNNHYCDVGNTFPLGPVISLQNFNDLNFHKFYCFIYFVQRFTVCGVIGIFNIQVAWMTITLTIYSLPGQTNFQFTTQTLVVEGDRCSHKTDSLSDFFVG